MESAKAGSARDSTVAAGCRLGSVIAVLAPAADIKGFWRD
jgi:hypothetical protein